jgi:FAD/FMN-containing dehydrogenase
MDKRFPLEDQIEMLGWMLRGRVIARGAADYDGLRQVENGNFDNHPAAIVRPANAADVAAVLNFAQATDLAISVRSGGHSIGGFSTNDGGLVIDLRDLNALEVDASAMTAWAGTGLSAGEVSKALEAKGLIVGFGDSASVGIGGLTLGGGVGYLVRRDGLTIDSLLAAEIVTANGDIIVADEINHPDLFWALRGGGGNFGVVTRLKFRLHELPHFVGGALILPATAEVIAGFADASAQAPEELSTIAMVMPAPPLPFLPAEVHGKLVLMGMIAYAGAPAYSAAALAPFRALAKPYADLVRPAPYSSMYMPEPPRTGVTVRSRFVNTFGVAEAQMMLDRLAACDAPMKMAQFRVLGGAYARVPAEATAYAHRDAKMMVAYLAMYGAGEQPAYDRWADEGIALFGEPDGGAYVNFLGREGMERVRAAYPGATWDRLRQVKRRYDPENVFRLNQNIPPAV